MIGDVGLLDFATQGFDLILLGSDCLYNIALCLFALGNEKRGLLIIEEAKRSALLLGADDDLRFVDRVKELKLKSPLELFPYESQELLWENPLDPKKRSELRKRPVSEFD